ncbi:hypothetical protein [Candidatus Magnetobacterium casense]|uniref:Uncharacterized protein n=1 Tax=Candidatus Magnetobacterium casense TaxID=1455061 RepID=A0ABS6RX07_9BACT|nr:hypothetical protein [Candidatus Magnetobacterium casensis]MBV6340885.1 hypothetical protein [Candidatus Magnetobacterium casensis]
MNFVEAGDGSFDFGCIDEEVAGQIKRLAAPIRLQRGNENYGEIHIEQRHGQEIRKVGYKSVRDFVEDITKNFTQIRDNGTRLLLVKTNGLPCSAAIDLSLSLDGNYYTVITAGTFGSKYLNNKELLWQRSPRPSSPGRPEQPPTIIDTTPAEALKDDAGRIGQSSSLTLIVEHPDEPVKGQRWQ